MIIFPASLIIEYHCQQNTEVLYIKEIASVQPVLFTIKSNPVVLIHALRVIEIIYRAIGHPAIIGEMIVIDTKLSSE